MIAFLGTEAGFFVDLFLVVLVALLPLLAYAVYLVRKGRVKAHAKTMVLCYVAFLLAVIAFEAQVHLGTPGPPLPRVPLTIHLCFAVPCLLLWTYQIYRGKHAFFERNVHVLRGRILLALFVLTVGTGAWLYAVTF